MLFRSDPQRFIDLKSLTDQMVLRGIDVPILIRLSDIMSHRLKDLHDAFQAAISQHGYQGKYACVYPIKVNQQRKVVEEVVRYGQQYGFGL